MGFEQDTVNKESLPMPNKTVLALAQEFKKSL